MTASEHVNRIARRFTDFDEQQEAIADWDQQYFRMESGDFDGGIDLLQIGSNLLFRERLNRQFRYQGSAPRGHYAISWPFKRTKQGIWAGERFSADTVIFQKPQQEVDLLSSNTLDVLILSVPAKDVDAICNALTVQKGFSGATSGAVHLSPEATARLRALARGLLYPRGSVSDPEGDCNLDSSYQQLLKQVVFELVIAQKERADEPRPMRSAEIVRQATELVLTDPTNLIGLIDICNTLRVSLRALQYAFRDATGMPAATWLRHIRLNRVHKSLATASPDETKIKTVAGEQGFVHLGHFTEQYRRLFGCLPSETLQAA